MIRQRDIWVLEAGWYSQPESGTAWQREVAYFSTKRDATAVGEALAGEFTEEQEYEFTVRKIEPWPSISIEPVWTVGSIAAHLAKEWDL